MPTLRLLCRVTLALLGTFALPAAEPPPAQGGAEALPEFFRQFDWTRGPAQVNVGGMAQLTLQEGYLFTGAKGAQAILNASGNPTSGDELGFLAPASLDWSVIFEFDEVGFVKDDEKDKLDADAMLTSIRKGNEAANQWRRENGQAELQVTGWKMKPTYNETSHNLEWAILGESEGRPVVNYNVRLLGRKGVMSATLLVEPEALDAVLPAYQGLLAQYRFTEGHRYAEYRQGDKLAQYGLAALVVGGAAAGAAKLGLFAWVAVLFKKAWKVIVIVIAAVAAGIRRLVHGGRREPTT